MQNVGTWNSDLALIYGLFFAFPFFLLIIKEIVAVMPRPKTITKVEYVPLPAKTVYETKTKVVYKKVYKNNKRRPTYRKQKPIKQTAQAKPSFLSPIQTDAIAALRSIGVKQSDAKSLALSKFDPNKHSNFESLFRDCMNQS